MADLRLYPNLPGVVSSISVETQVPTFDDSKPKFLLLGWHSQDKFQDGTPIKFNEPYFVINDTMLSDMFGTTDKLGLHAKIVGTTANWEVIPVVVRTGKPDVKVGGAGTEAAVTLAQPADSKVTVTDVAEVSWVDEPTWRSNYSLTVTVDTSKNASVYLNGSETPLITGSAATGLYIPQLGLTVKALNDNADQTAYFKFQYAVGEALEYGQYDVEFGVIDVDSYSTTKAAVTAPKTSTAKIGTTSASDIKIGKPIGMTMFDVYQWDMGKDPWYQVQDPITILADRMILLAVDPAHKDVAYEAGDILVLDPSGFPVPFDVTVDAAGVYSVAAAVTMLKDTLKYHVGRLVKVIDLAKEPMFTGGLENVEYWPSEFAQGLPGKQNGGVTDGIDETTKKGLLIQLEF